MDLEQLQQQWAAYDAKLDKALNLSQEAVRAATLARARHTLGWHQAFIVLELLGGLFFAGWLGNFSFEHWGQWEFVGPALLLHVWMVACMIFVGYQLVAFRQIDYSAPIVAIQQKLELRRIARIRFTQAALAIGVIFWPLWLVVGLKGLWNVSAYANGSQFVIISLAASVAVVALAMLVARLPALRRFSDSLAGASLPAAIAHLDQLQHDAVRPATPDARRILLYTAGVSATVLACYILLAYGLVYSTAPQMRPSAAAPQARLAGPCPDCITLRDGATLGVTRTPGSASMAIVLVHNVLDDSRALAGTAQALHATTGAEIWNIDLRGHGRSSGAAGDIAYTGQYDDDIADLLATIRRQRPAARLILGGHGTGAGIAMSYAAKGHSLADAYLLLAPIFGGSSPSARKPEQAGYALHGRRSIGLLMLHLLGIHSLDGLPALYFNTAPGNWIEHYSFRAARSLAPRDIGQALAADDKPLLVLAAERDRYADAATLIDLSKQHKHGSAQSIPGADANTILTNPQMLQAAARWLQ